MGHRLGSARLKECRLSGAAWAGLRGVAHGGRRGGLHSSSPRARARGLYGGQSPGSRPGLLWGAVPGLAPGAFMRSSPRARARGLYGERGRGCPCYLAGLASKRRQDAEAKLAWSERRQDAVANVRRDGTGNPDPREDVASCYLPGLAPGAFMGGSPRARARGLYGEQSPGSRPGLLCAGLFGQAGPTSGGSAMTRARGCRRATPRSRGTGPGPPLSRPPGRQRLRREHRPPAHGSPCGGPSSDPASHHM